MFWLRRLTVYVASLLLLFALVLVAYLLSLQMAFNSSGAVKKALQSKQAYDGFITLNTERATKILTQDISSTIGIDKLQPLVKKAVAAAYPKSFYDESSSKIIDSNYDWLTSKTAKPDFTVDLSAAKTRFETQFGSGAGDVFGSLPNCSIDQLRQIGSVELNSLLKLACKPAGVSPRALATQFAQQVSAKTPLLTNPVITADNPNPFQTAATGSKPYYKKLAYLPNAYKAAKQFPIYIAIIAALMMLYIVLVDRPHRHSWRVLARTFIVAGILLAAGKLITVILLNKVIISAIDNAGGSQYADSFGSIYRSITSVMTEYQFKFGLAYIGIGLVIITVLFATRNRNSNRNGLGSRGLKDTPSKIQTSPDAQPTTQQTNTNPMPNLVQRKQKPGGLNRRGIIQ